MVYVALQVLLCPEYAFVNLRYKLPNQDKSILLNQAVQLGSKPLEKANSDTRFAIAVASYAQQLKGGQYNGAVVGIRSFNLVSNLLNLIHIKCVQSS